MSFPSFSPGRKVFLNDLYFGTEGGDSNASSFAVPSECMGYYLGDSREALGISSCTAPQDLNLVQEQGATEFLNMTQAFAMICTGTASQAARVSTRSVLLTRESTRWKKKSMAKQEVGNAQRRLHRSEQRTRNKLKRAAAPLTMTRMLLKSLRMLVLLQKARPRLAAGQQLTPRASMQGKGGKGSMRG